MFVKYQSMDSLAESPLGASQFAAISYRREDESLDNEEFYWRPYSIVSRVFAVVFIVKCYYLSMNAQYQHPATWPKSSMWQSWRSWTEAPAYLRKLDALPSVNKELRIPVVLFPGLGANEYAMGVVKHMLKRKGFVVYGWGQGLNRGLNEDILAKTFSDVKRQLKNHKQPAHFIGWSLGGLVARELAKLFLAGGTSVHSVTTLGTPLNTMPVDPFVLALYRVLSGEKPDHELFKHHKLYEAPNCWTTSIYSKCDSIVPWGSSIQLLEHAPKGSQNIEIQPGHIAMIRHPETLYHIYNAMLSVLNNEMVPSMEPDAWAAPLRTWFNHHYSEHSTL